MPTTRIIIDLNLEDPDLANSLREGLQKIAEYTAATSFTDGKSDTPDRQDAGLGLAIAHWSRWDGVRILQVAFSALQDANFHSEAAQVNRMLESLGEEDLG